MSGTAAQDEGNLARSRGEGEVSIDDIPRDVLLEMVKETMWYSGGRKYEGKEGYSCEVDEETAHTQIMRGTPLFATPEEAIINYYQKFYLNR